MSSVFDKFELRPLQSVADHGVEDRQQFLHAHGDHPLRLLAGDRPRPAPSTRRYAARRLGGR